MKKNNLNELKMLLLTLEVVDVLDSAYLLSVSNNDEKTQLSFNHSSKKIEFFGSNSIAKALLRNEYQFRKILHNKQPRSYYKGFTLNFSILDKKDVLAFNKKSNVIGVDFRNNSADIFIVENPLPEITIVYTDGCFLQDIGQGGFAFLVKYVDGNTELHKAKSNMTSSCLIELEAVIEALSYLNTQDELRIVTDSLYVRKGMSEWMLHWKLNNWHTANGEKVKNIEHWQKLDKLMENKYIEIQWVKGHNECAENLLCDKEAREIANPKKIP